MTPRGMDIADGGRAVVRRFAANVRAGLCALVQPPRRPREALQVWIPHGRLTAWAVISLCVVVAVMFGADTWAAAQRGRVPDGLIPVFRFFSEAGRSVWVLLPAGLLLLALAAAASAAPGRGTARVLAAVAVRTGFVFTAVGLPGLAVSIVKRLIGRARPDRVDGQHIFFSPFSWSNDYASLPSGHSTTAFAAAVAFGALFPRARLPLFAFAIMIALSRVVLGAHYPSDIIAGAVFGGVGALLVRAWFAERRLGFGVAADGSVRAFAGPSLRRIRRALGELAGCVVGGDRCSKGGQPADPPHTPGRHRTTLPRQENP